LNVSVGPVRFRETGPYGNGHYVVKTFAKSPELAAESVYATWTYASTEWQHRRELPFIDHLRNLESTDLAGQIEVFRSKIRPTEEGGGIHFETMIDQKITLENWYGQVLGHLAREWYCGWVPPVGHELERAEVSPDLVITLRKLSEGIDVLDKLYSETIRTADDLFRKTKSLKSEHLMNVNDRGKIYELGKKLEELEQLSERVGNTQEPLQAIHRLSKVLMHNLTGKRVSEVAEETVGVYRFLRIGISGLKNWTQHTLGLARPIAVENPTSVISINSRKAPQRSPSA
jgi:hypothetical protein